MPLTFGGMRFARGPLTLGQRQGEVFLGRDFAAAPDYSDQVAFEIDSEVRRLIDDVVQDANKDLAQVERVKRFTLIGKELDHEDGELTATQKVKRRAIEEEFASDIEGLYS